jgi:hypothetical protein
MSAADAKRAAAERKPFDSIEDSLEYIGLLREAIEANKAIVAEQARAAQAARAPRRAEALQLAVYKLERLGRHVDDSRRILNDLRMLRRLLLGERQRT